MHSNLFMTCYPPIFYRDLFSYLVNFAHVLSAFLLIDFGVTTDTIIINNIYDLLFHNNVINL